VKEETELLNRNKKPILLAHEKMQAEAKAYEEERSAFKMQKLYQKYSSFYG